ncbi:MAG: hypothetical protein SPL15_06390 [Lachnospiraceae bacterium]|nr:hypothetical protein [Lachnospiraceae bacterium]MDY5742604.1 hypothetical protein [Lachnospiraceae bacterium]
MSDRAIVTFIDKQHDLDETIEIPLQISANELVLALNKTFSLGMNEEKILECYLVAENPIAFLRGSRSLAEFGVRNGSRIIFDRG